MRKWDLVTTWHLTWPSDIAVWYIEWPITTKQESLVVVHRHSIKRQRRQIPMCCFQRLSSQWKRVGNLLKRTAHNQANAGYLTYVLTCTVENCWEHIFNCPPIFVQKWALICCYSSRINYNLQPDRFSCSRVSGLETRLEIAVNAITDLWHVWNEPLLSSKVTSGCSLMSLSLLYSSRVKQCRTT